MFDKNAMIFFLIGMVLIGGLAYVMGQAAGNTIMLKEDVMEDKTLITVAGNAERKIEPTLVKFTVGVETTNENAELSSSENAEIMERVKQALIAKGIPENKIRTNYYYINQNWYYPKEDVKPVIEYKTTHSLSVETTQISEIGKIIDSCVTAGANQVGNVQFTLDDETINEIKKELVSEAILNSKEKAESMASDLGQQIVSVKSMSTSSDYYVDYNYYNRLLEADVGQAAKVDTEIFQTEVTVSAYVSGEYYSQ